MIPKAPGDKVKTDTRECRRLARLHGAGELVAVRIPILLEEAVRGLFRARGDMVEGLTRSRNRLTKFLLHHSLVWRGGANWTVKHEAWLTVQGFDEPALQITFDHCWAVVRTRHAGLAVVQADMRFVVRQAVVRRSRASSGPVSGSDQDGCAQLAGRSLRLAPLRPGNVVHGPRRPRPERVLDRGKYAPWSDHQSRQHSPAIPAGRVGLVLPAPPLRGREIAKRHEWPPPGGGRAWAAQLRPCGRFRKWQPTRTPRAWWRQPSPGSSPGSCGPKWSRDMTSSDGDLGRLAG